MDNNGNRVFLGTFAKPHGINGALLLKNPNRFPPGLNELELVFVEIDAIPVPFFFKKTKPLRQHSKNALIVHLDHICTTEQAKAFIGKKVYCNLPKSAQNSTHELSPAEQIQGFEVIDQKFGHIGKVKQVLDFPKHALLQVFRGEKEVLIPFNPEIVLEINPPDKTIQIAAPEGLLEIYL